MSLKKLITSYTRYNHWANETMSNWLKTLEPSLLYKETPSSFSSIDLTIQHMIDAQQHWLAFIGETGKDNSAEAAKPHDTDAHIRHLLAGAARMILQFDAYTEEELLKPLVMDGVAQPRYAYMLHAINHNTYHRGQIVTMSRCLGIMSDIPNTDYDVFLFNFP